MPFTSEELEAMRQADKEIDREYDEKFNAACENEQIDKWLDELVVADQLDHKQLHKRRYQRKYSAAYRAEHKDEIAAKKAAYYAEHKDEIAGRESGGVTTLPSAGSQSPAGKGWKHNVNFQGHDASFRPKQGNGNPDFQRGSRFRRPLRYG